MITLQNIQLSCKVIIYYPFLLGTIMSRYILDESKIHASIRSTISNNHRDFVEEIITVVESNSLVIIGMGINPVCKSACKFLTKKGLDFEYLEYGSYFKEWRKRNALKMWTGWKTFPMVFVNGVLIGGAEDLYRLINSNEFEQI